MKAVGSVDLHRTSPVNPQAFLHSSQRKLTLHISTDYLRERFLPLAMLRTTRSPVSEYVSHFLVQDVTQTGILSPC